MIQILPYVPLIRGLSLSFCYNRAQTGIGELLNEKGVKVFTGDRLIAKEFLDERQIVREKFPIALIKSKRITTRNIAERADTAPHWEHTNIVHTGTGTTEVSLGEAVFWGNNKYRLKITEAGTIGTNGKYELYLTPYTESGWGAEIKEVSSTAIPASGEVEIESEGGQVFLFIFEVGESVVLNDVYSWTVVAFKVANLIVRDTTIPLTIEIYCEHEKEFTESGGYIDQLLCFFGEKILCPALATGERQIVDEEVTGVEILPVMQEAREESPATLIGYQINLNVNYHGKIYKAIVAPLARVIRLEEPVLSEPGSLEPS